MVTPIADTGWLGTSEQPAGELRVAGGDDPAPRFSCYLDEQPDHLVPAHCLRSQSKPRGLSRDLYVNPACWFSRSGAPPDDIAGALAQLRDCAVADREMVWLRAPGNGMLQPFWLGPAFRSFLSGAVPGERAPLGLWSEVQDALVLAGVLVDREDSALQRETWNAAMSRGAGIFRQRGFVPVRQLIHPFHISAMRRYYRGMIRKHLMQTGDGQCAGRCIAHNEPVATLFHRQLTPVIAALAGEPVKPSYVYVASYQEGAVLEKHTDREQCEFSVTLCLDFAPEPHFATPWPILLHPPVGTTSIFQALGDGLLYRGREIHHSRDALNRGSISTSAFFHYVRQDFNGGLG